jgi:hypothetical protein
MSEDLDKSLQLVNDYLESVNDSDTTTVEIMRPDKITEAIRVVQAELHKKLKKFNQAMANAHTCRACDKREESVVFARNKCVAETAPPTNQWTNQYVQAVRFDDCGNFANVKRGKPFPMIYFDLKKNTTIVKKQRTIQLVPSAEYIQITRDYATRWKTHKGWNTFDYPTITDNGVNTEYCYEKCKNGHSATVERTHCSEFTWNFDLGLHLKGSAVIKACPIKLALEKASPTFIGEINKEEMLQRITKFEAEIQTIHDLISQYDRLIMQVLSKALT